MISDLNDFGFGSWSGSGQLQLTDGVCAHDSKLDSRYRIQIDGSGAGSAYTMSNGTQSLAYSVEYAGSDGVFSTMATAIRQRFQFADRILINCGGTTNGSIRITVSEANLLAAENGSYAGTITVIMTP